MVSSILSSSLILPALTTLIGASALTVGIYSILNPFAAARIYGIPVPIDLSQKSIMPDLTTILQKSSSEPSDTTESKPSQPPTPPHHFDQHHLALLYSLAIRNLTTGMTILTLTAALYTIPSTDSNVSLTLIVAVRKLLGLVLVFGSWVPIVDAIMCDLTYLNSGEKNGRRASLLHVGRAVAWAGVGVWCFFFGPGKEEAIEAVLGEAMKDVVVSEAVCTAVKKVFKDCFTED